MVESVVCPLSPLRRIASFLVPHTLSPKYRRARWICNFVCIKWDLLQPAQVLPHSMDSSLLLFVFWGETAIVRSIAGYNVNDKPDINGMPRAEGTL